MIAAASAGTVTASAICFPFMMIGPRAGCLGCGDAAESNYAIVGPDTDMNRARLIAREM